MAKATPAKATHPVQSPDPNPTFVHSPDPDPTFHTPDDANRTDDADHDAPDVTADLMTVLRHLVENQQWGGNHGARAECDEAFKRLQDNAGK